MANIWVNKRRSERVPCNLPVAWIRQGKPQNVVAADASAHGMFLRTEESTLPGSLMQLEVAVPDGMPPLLMFVFARFIGNTSAGRGVGTEIYVISDRDRRRWSRYYRICLDEWKKNGSEERPPLQAAR